MTTDYQFWLTANCEKQKIQLPVNPEKITIKHGSANDTISIAELGDITVFKGRPAVEFSFSSFFPTEKFAGVKTKTITKPLTLAKRIANWLEQKKIIHFIVTQLGINLYCSIESFQYEEQGGDVGTIHYSITLKEYREVKTRRVKVNTTTQTATVSKEEPRVDNSHTPKTYTVVYGDCLWNLAKRFYGNGMLYTKLYEANKAIIGPNPNTLYVGWVLTIPE